MCGKKFKNNKKGLSPVVAVALLLVLAVVVVVGFETWFESFRVSQNETKVIQNEIIPNLITSEITNLNKNITQYEFEYRINDYLSDSYEIIEINFIDSKNTSQQCFIYRGVSKGGITCK